jgi:hypothetical protein
MSRADAETTLVWVPSHIGIEGNEIADRLANAALDSDIVELDIGLELGDEFPAVDRFVLEKWQEDWDRETTGASTEGWSLASIDVKYFDSGHALRKPWRFA